VARVQAEGANGGVDQVAEGKEGRVMAPHPNSSSSALASFRSGVSNPSVNQP
jgi:hypothetical protein